MNQFNTRLCIKRQPIAQYTAMLNAALTTGTNKVNFYISDNAVKTPHKNISVFIYKRCIWSSLLKVDNVI